MVLSRLTKITGPGISTDTNWVGDNANYTGIVTANSFVGDGSELVGVASTDNIITGTPATFNTYPVSMNAGVNVAGVATFTGNVSIAGTLTYEDVTNIDSVGIITARNDLKVGTGVTITPAGGGFFSGIVTATSFTGDGANITGVAVTEAPVLSYEIFGPNNNQYFWWGGGVDNTEPNPDLFLQRGQMYRFVNNAGSAHPLEIRYAQSGPEFTSGVRGDKTGVQLFTVPYDAPAKLRYQCVPHTNMGGAIYIRGADGNQEKVGLTTFRNAINIQSDDSSPGRIRFYCEVNNIHYVTLKAPAHANFSGYPVVTLPNITGTLLTSNNANISGIVTATGANINGDVVISDSIVHSGDTNTKIRFPEADAVTIETNGNERFRINSSGAWGIGAAYGSSGQVLTSGGSGSSPSWTTITGTTINNNTNDCIVTATGTTNVLQGESELRWQNGNNLFVRAGEGESATLNLIADQGDDNGDGWKIQSEQDENDLTFKSNISGSYVDKLKLKSNGQLEVQGNLISTGEISPSGHINLASSKKLSMASDVFKIYHSTDAAIINESGDLLINQNVSNKDIKISTGSGPTERVRIHSNGIVSMGDDHSGAATLGADLNVVNVTGANMIVGDTVSGEYLEFIGTGGAASVGSRSNHPLRLFTNGSSNERLRITTSGRFGFNRSAPHYAMHLSPAAGETRIDLHMTNDTTGHNAGDGVQFGYQNGAGAYIWNFENTPIYFGQNNIKKFEIHATGSTQIYKGDLLLGPDNVSQMEATIRAWGCSLWYTTIDSDYFHDSGGEYRQFYNKGEESGENYLTAYNCPIQTGVGPQNRNFWRGAQNDTRAEGTVNVGVGYRGAFFFISRTCPDAIRSGSSGKYLYDSNSPNRVSVSFDSFGNNMDTQELSFHAGSSAGYNSGDATVGGRLGSSNTDTTLRMYAVGVNMQNYNAPNNKKAGNHLGISVINEDGTDYGSSRLSENLINNGTTGSTNGGGSSTEFNWGTRHSNDRGYNSNMQFSQILYFDGIQLNSSQWDYLEHYFKVMYG